MKEPTLLFFRKRPSDQSVADALISSMQSLETSFFLVALKRYSHALVTCALAIESALFTSKLGSMGNTGLRHLLARTRSTSPAVAALSQDLLDDFRKARNRIVHVGFSQQDDSEAARLYLEVALPLIAATYRDLHSYDLEDALLQDFVTLLRASREVHRRAQTLKDFDRSYSLNAFGHFIQLCSKRDLSTSWESDALERADQNGTIFEAVRREKELLSGQFEVSWNFDCPICGSYESAVCELDAAELQGANIVPNRLACPSCGFVVRASDKFMSEVLLEEQILSAREQILTEYGFR